MSKRILITHIQPPERKLQGVDQLFFYTKTGERYSWGIDNNFFEKSQIDLWVKDKKLYELKEYIVLSEDKTLWIDEKNIIYRGNAQDINSNQEIGKLEDLIL
ncbi:MAG: hypothetical protein Q8O84_03650 [Nanoarchaeota archaeon]|nr:hypothetical protein [Nanoarchaeota archaeon]